MALVHLNPEFYFSGCDRKKSALSGLFLLKNVITPVNKSIISSLQTFKVLHAV